jgi:hypothetical protein
LVVRTYVRSTFCAPGADPTPIYVVTCFPIVKILNMFSETCESLGAFVYVGNSRPMDNRAIHAAGCTDIKCVPVRDWATGCV